MRSFKLSLDHTRRDAMIVCIIIAIIAGRHFYIRAHYFLAYSTSDVDKFAALIAERNDPLLCNKIIPKFFGVSESELQNDCFRQVAKLLQDDRVCDYTRYPEACKTEVKCRGPHCLYGY